MALAQSTGSSLGKSGIPGYNLATIPRLNPQSKNLFQSLLGGIDQSQLGQGLGQTSRLAGGDQSQFAQMEAPALRQFQDLGANLASRFSGLGSGARYSSGFQNALAGEAGNLSERLASNRMGLQRQAIQDLLGLSQSLFGNQPDEYSLAEKPTPFWQTLLGKFAQGAGAGLGKGATGGYG
jgi:hypothetical protein